MIRLSFLKVPLFFCEIKLVCFQLSHNQEEQVQVPEVKAGIGQY